MGSEDAVIGLDDRIGHLWGGVHGELQLGLLAVVARQLLEQERALFHREHFAKRKRLCIIQLDDQQMYVRDQNQYHHRTSGRRRSPGDQSSCPPIGESCP